jgi:hypothetical protein
MCKIKNKKYEYKWLPPICVNGCQLVGRLFQVRELNIGRDRIIVPYSLHLKLTNDTSFLSIEMSSEYLLNC